MLTALKIIGIVIISLITIIVLFVICFVGRNIWNAVGYMLRYIGGTLRNVVFGGLGLLLLILLLIAIFKDG